MYLCLHEFPQIHRCSDPSVLWFWFIDVSFWTGASLQNDCSRMTMLRCIWSCFWKCDWGGVCVVHCNLSHQQSRRGGRGCFIQGALSVPWRCTFFYGVTTIDCWSRLLIVQPYPIFGIDFLFWLGQSFHFCGVDCHRSWVLGCA